MRSNRLITIRSSLLMRIVATGALFFITLVPMGCHSANFDNRLSSAKAYLASRQGEPLARWTHEQIAPRITPILQHCFSSIENADTTGFMMVADVDSFGKMINVAVRPLTNVASCVAHTFESEVFEKPPLKGNEQSFPVVFDLGAHVP